MKRYREITSKIRWSVCEQPDDVQAPRVIRDAETAARVFRSAIGDVPTERVVVLLLGARGELLAVSQASAGTAESSLIHPREVFGPALRASASSVIVLHNHPSGDPAPSGDDLEVRHRLEASGDLLGVPMVDFIVVGRGEQWSARERGKMGR
jgi:DNA repair protein RadC